MAPSASIIVKPIGQLAQFASRLFQAPKDDIRGITPDAWYSPLQPVKPMGPEGEEPKGFQFYAGQNLIWTPRPDAEYSAWELKDLATYPLARICIENVKDQMSRIPWSAQLKRKPGENKKQMADRAKGHEGLLRIQRFFERPDRENCFDDWVRPLLDDMLVIDAASILVRKTFSGEVAELRVAPGEMFTRYIDKNGYTPLPPDPAYAQIWWGVPLVDLTTEQLIYKPRNIVRRGTISSNLYGMSPTEQLALEIVPGRQRLAFVTAYYTAGSIPDVVQVIPPGVPPDKIAEAMQWMNSELAGNLAAKRQWRMVQGFQQEGKQDQILFPKEPLLADAFDELHIRKICYGYGTSPQRLMRMMGTRNAAEQQEAAENEGLIPWLEYLKNLLNYITQITFGMQDVEWTYDAEREPDPAKQAERLKVLVSCGAITENESREELGLEPRPEAEADMLGIVTGTGFMPLAAEDQIAQQETLGTDPESQHKRNVEVAASKPAPVVSSGDDKPTDAVGKPNGHAKPNGKDKSVHAMGFAAVLDVPVLERGHLEITKESKRKFASVQVNCPPVVEAKIVSKGRDLIPDEHLASHGRILDSHVTVRFGVKDDQDKLRKVLASFQPFTVVLGRTVVFQPGEHSGDACPVVIDVQSEELVRLNKAIAAEMAAKEDDFEYHPHCTLAYVKTGVAEQYDNLDDFDGLMFTVNAVVLSSLDGTLTKFPLRAPFSEKLTKNRAYQLVRPKIAPHLLTPQSQLAARSFQVAVHNLFRRMEAKAVKLLAKRLLKTKRDEEQLLKQVIDAAAADWGLLPDEVQALYEQAALGGVSLGAVQVSISDEDMLTTANQTASQWAEVRAAELVGMRRLADGSLVANPSAKWAITESTRDDLRTVIRDLFQEESPTLKDVEERVMQSGIYSDTRASMIARTEIGMAQAQGNLAAWRASGKVRSVEFQLSASHDRDDECDAAAGGGPYKLNESPVPPLHPNCDCVLVLNEIEGED